MNIDDAIHLLTSNHPGGAEALALRMGQDPVQFRSKANPQIDRAYFRPRELVQMQQLAGRYDILFAMADELGHVVFPKLEFADGDVVAVIQKLTQEFSDVLKETTVAMADGRLSDNERKRLQHELTELMSVAGTVIPTLEKVSDAT